MLYVWELLEGIAAEIQLVPFDVRTLPEAPGEVIPVPPFTTAKNPVIPVDNGRPVKLVATPECGVPNLGVTKVGEVKVGELDLTIYPFPVVEISSTSHDSELLRPKTLLPLSC